MATSFDGVYAYERQWRYLNFRIDAGLGDRPRFNVRTKYARFGFGQFKRRLNRLRKCRGKVFNQRFKFSTFQSRRFENNEEHFKPWRRW